MESTQQAIRERLLYVLHLGLVEARNLALAKGDQRLADLADTLELLPQYAARCGDDDNLEMIRFVLRNYQDKYPGSINLPERFEADELPERFSGG